METYRARDCFKINNHYGTFISIFNWYYKRTSWSLDTLPRLPEGMPMYWKYVSCPTGPHKKLREAVANILGVSGKTDKELTRLLIKSGKCFDLVQAEKICTEAKYFPWVGCYILIQGANGKIFVLSCSHGSSPWNDGPSIHLTPIKEEFDLPVGHVCFRN